MKKKIFLTLFIGCAVAAAFITSCKKKDDSSTTTTPTSAQIDANTKQNNDDANNYKSESDQNDNDVNGAIGGSSLMSMPVVHGNNNMNRLGKGSTNSIQGNSTPPCGAMIDSSGIAHDSLVFNFDGITHCGYWPIRTRSGQIIVHLTGASRWDLPGAVLTVTFNNYKITRVDNGHWMQFNGTKTLLNPSGFNWLGFAFNDSLITYKERVSNMQVTFDGGSSAVWNSSRTVTWKCNNFIIGDYTFSTIGDTTVYGFNQTSEWGTNRFNTGFVTNYNAWLVSNSLCSYWRPTSGELVYNVLNTNNTVAGSFTFTLGLDAQGHAVTSGCAYYFKVTWKDSNNNTQYTVLPYL